MSNDAQKYQVEYLWNALTSCRPSRRGRELTLLGLGQPGHGVKLGARIERRAG
jgi:hypothetical protein